jgi:hypothetical protein
MRDKIESLYQRNRYFSAIVSPFKRVYDYYRFHVLDEKKYIENRFERVFGYKPNLKEPKTLNEKIQWLKLNDRTPLHTLCSDKLEVRNYIKEKIGEKYLIPLLYHTDSPNNLKKESLPEAPFVIKANHDSGGVIFVYDKVDVNWKSVRSFFNKRLRKNYYYATKEWQYKNIKPQIIVEKLMLNSNGVIPNDIKIHCFNGKAQMICVDIERGKNSHCRNWYNTKWKREPYSWSSIKKGRKTSPANFEVKKPQKLDEMIELSEQLSEAFFYARIDWYEIEEELFFGEITFHHDSGFRPIEPSGWDLKLGKKLKLNDK